MSTRYEETTDEVRELLSEVRDRFFPELVNAKIKVLFDTKKRKSGGRIILGSIMKTNDLLRHLTRDDIDVLDGYDYIITLDKLCWYNVAERDRSKIIRHELRHTLFDPESETNPYKLVAHSISDFYEEVELNKDDPRWRERVGDLVENIYEQQKEQQQESGKKKKRKFGSL